MAKQRNPITRIRRPDGSVLEKGTMVKQASGAEATITSLWSDGTADVAIQTAKGTFYARVDVGKVDPVPQQEQNDITINIHPRDDEPHFRPVPVIAQEV